jgi:hypothetical protein
MMIASYLHKFKIKLQPTGNDERESIDISVTKQMYKCDRFITIAFTSSVHDNETEQAGRKKLKNDGHTISQRHP